MNSEPKPALIYSTYPSADAAQVAGEALIAAGLAACVNILPEMRSIYEWQGRVNIDHEVVLIAKTRDSLTTAAMRALAAGHPYETPALFVIPVGDAWPPYLKWLLQQTEPKT